MKIEFVNESIGCLHAKLIGNEFFFNFNDVCSLIGINSTEEKDAILNAVVLPENLFETLEHSKDWSQILFLKVINWRGVDSLIENSLSENKIRVRNWLDHFVFPVSECIFSQIFHESFDENLEIIIKGH